MGRATANANPRSNGDARRTTKRALALGACISAAAFFAAAGCKKSSNSAAASARHSEAAASIPAAGQTQAPAPPPLPSSGTNSVNLNRELRRWILRNRRPPKNFEEFAATAGVDIPPPPPGKKYTIDRSMHVTLEKL
ncbi:MAG TPA: hypothetical protein VHH88_11215 [Verrucomicrobiae bacterium]|nr:hypothetical protein [Verrucomicrobiae bacterium]